MEHNLEIKPIINLTNICNMACTYCYAAYQMHERPANFDHISNTVLNKIDELAHFVNQVVQHNGRKATKLLFHSLEPLIINANVLETLFLKMKSINNDIKITVQTNGTLITDDHINILNKYNVKVSVSLDGNRYHNKHRLFANGVESHEVVVRNIARLKHFRVTCGTLSTVTRSNISDPSGFYNYFKSNGYKLDFRPYFSTTCIADESITPEEYLDFNKKIFDMWLADDDVKSDFIPAYKNIILRMSGKNISTCNHSKSCLSFLAVNIDDGSVYPCNRLNKIDAFYLGNIYTQSLDSIINSSLRQELSQRWNMLSKTDCLACNAANYCYGGCPANGYYSHNSYFNKDYYCDAIKGLITHIHKKVGETFE